VLVIMTYWTVKNWELKPEQHIALRHLGAAIWVLLFGRSLLGARTFGHLWQFGAAVWVPIH